MPTTPPTNPGRPPGARRIRDYFNRYKVAFGLGFLFLVLTQGFALTAPQLLRLATDALIEESFGDVSKYATLLIVVAILGAFTRVLSRLFIFNSGRRVEYDIRNELFAKLCQLPPSYYQHIQTGQIMSRAINDLTQVRLLLGAALLNVINTALVYIVVVPLLFSSDAELAFYSFLTLPFLALAGRYFAKKMYVFSREAQDRLGFLSNRVQENLGGVLTVRSYQREAAEIQEFSGINDEYVRVNLSLAKLRGVVFPLMGFFGSFGTIVLLWLGGQRIMSGRMTIGDFVQFSAYLAALTWPTIALGWMLSVWQRGIAAMDRINEIFAEVPSIQDGAREGPAIELGKIELRGLTFRYPGRSKDDSAALDDIHLEIQPGERVAIVGRTGSGKSTLLRALVRLIEVPKGTVFVDGVDVVDLPLDLLRAAVSYAPQDAFLFSRSIFENVAFGDAKATHEDVENIVDRAGLAPDLGGFPEGLNTLVGERGVTLSGGQRQRVALARAMLLDAPILLLDDTLAAVDTDTERRILNALAKGDKKQTLIMVTHRLAGAQLADRIFVMDDGRIVESGTEQELLDKGGLYSEMHARQRLREALEERPLTVEGAPA